MNLEERCHYTTVCPFNFEHDGFPIRQPELIGQAGEWYGYVWKQERPCENSFLSYMFCFAASPFLAALYKKMMGTWYFEKHTVKKDAYRLEQFHALVWHFVPYKLPLVSQLVIFHPKPFGVVIGYEHLDTLTLKMDNRKHCAIRSLPFSYSLPLLQSLFAYETLSTPRISSTLTKPKIETINQKRSKNQILNPKQKNLGN